MARAKVTDEIAHRLGPVHSAPDVQMKAARKIKAMVQAGHLDRIFGWPGDTLSGWLSMLGLPQPPEDSPSASSSQAM